MRTSVSLAVPQPCHESWAAMMPAGAGRHCAACQHTVVDFTLSTDAEILAYLARAAGARICGRFAAGKLARPLQRAVPAAPTAARWRAWLAAVVAVWAVREVASSPAHAQAPAEWRARYWGGPVPATKQTEAPATPNLLPLETQKPLVTIVRPEIAHGVITKGMVSSQAMMPMLAQPVVLPWVLRGVITDFSNDEALPGVTVLLKGTTTGTSTRADGTFELPVPAELAGAAGLSITVSSIGYLTQERPLVTKAAVAAQNFQLRVQVMGLLGEVVVCRLPPAPWHPRRFYYWGKY